MEKRTFLFFSTMPSLANSNKRKVFDLHINGFFISPARMSLTYWRCYTQIFLGMRLKKQCDFGSIFTSVIIWKSKKSLDNCNCFCSASHVSDAAVIFQLYYYSCSFLLWYIMLHWILTEPCGIMHKRIIHACRRRYICKKDKTNVFFFKNVILLCLCAPTVSIYILL